MTGERSLKSHYESQHHSSAVADHITSTGHNIKGTISKFWQEDSRTPIA